MAREVHRTRRVSLQVCEAAPKLNPSFHFCSKRSDTLAFCRRLTSHCNAAFRRPAGPHTPLTTFALLCQCGQLLDVPYDWDRIRMTQVTRLLQTEMVETL